MKINNCFRIACIICFYCTPMLNIHSQSICDFGIYGGTNMSKLSERFFSYNNRWGYQAGFEIKVGNKWCQFEVDLGYSNMGVKYNLTNEVGPIDGGQRQVVDCKFNGTGHFMDLPVSLALGWWDPHDSGFGFTVSGGAYMEIGVAGKINLKENVYNYLYNVRDDFFTIEHSGAYFGDAAYQYKRFDAGWTVGAKVCLGEVFRIGASYRHGLINLSNVNGYKVKKNTFFLNFIFVLIND